MIQVSIDVFNTRWISIKFKCSKCSEEFETDAIGIPSPYFSAESARDSFSENSETSLCPNCNKEFTITALSSFTGGYIDIDADENEIVVVVEHLEKEYERYIDGQIESILDELDYYSTFKNGIYEIEQLAELSKIAPSLERIILMNSYSGLVTQLETYLQNALVTNVMTRDEYFQSFIETFENFKRQKFSISEIFSKQSELKDKAKFELSELIYHNLHRIRPIYISVFSIKIPDISEVMKIVKIRHDLVHRGGKDKDGNLVNIGKQEFDKAKTEIIKFINELNGELNKIL